MEYLEPLNIEPHNLASKITSDTILFFDLDGTLVETNLANYLSYMKAIQSVTEKKINICYTPHKRFNRSVLIDVIPNLDIAEYNLIIKEKEIYYKDFLSKTKLNKAVVDILLKYSGSIRTILVTNCRKDRALLTLDYYDLTKKFSDIFYRQFGKNEEKINKYKNAISRLGISGSSVIVFENERPEIDDAIVAGIDKNNILSL